MTRLATIGPPGDLKIYASPDPAHLRTISRLQPVLKADPGCLLGQGD